MCGNNFVCLSCVGEEYLKDRIIRYGVLHNCHFCDSNNQCITIEELAEYVHAALTEHFSMTSSEPEGMLDCMLAREGRWEQSGEPVCDVIAEIASIEENIVDDVLEYLSDHYGGDPFDPDIGPYDSESHYEESRTELWEMNEQWAFFREEISTRSRFFSSHAKQALDEIFRDLGLLRVRDGSAVLREVGMGDENRFIYRARICYTERDVQDALASPVQHLGPPAPKKARAGRMNASGISVFYGALDHDTCVTELRAPVGSHVVVGRFEIIRPIRLLDFDALTRAYVEGSYFDPESKTKWERSAFLKNLVYEVSRPILPRDEEHEYLPTQAVAAYLSEFSNPSLDGIIFHSSQTDREGRNVVLFHPASAVEPYSLPGGTKVDVSMGWVSEDDYDDSITVFERIPSESRDTSARNPSEGDAISTLLDISGSGANNPETRLEDRESTLRLDVESISVVKIKANNPRYDSRMVSRHRSTMNEDNQF